MLRSKEEGQDAAALHGKEEGQDAAALRSKEGVDRIRASLQEPNWSHSPILRVLSQSH